MLSQEELKAYREVGKLAGKVREDALELVKPEQKLLTIAEKAEDLIRKGGAEPAFPCNISLNEIAAHYTPPANDETKIEKGDLVTVDIGAHLDGYIGDTAATVSVGGKEDQKIVKAVQQVLEKAIEAANPGVNVGEIGGVIESAAKENGFKPIKNLTGHSLDRWKLHAGISIPNVEKESEEELKEGDVIALEPFITYGAGEVEDKPEIYIFRYLSDANVSGRMPRQTLRRIKKKYGHLPFAERWLAKDMSKIRLKMTLSELITSRSLHPYYVLKEKKGGKVAQAEHTIIITEDGSEVTTR
ncbi:methionine aminopeptidase [candidate division MSBL1 archaeon SCGC-AAA385D11]|uniref:Methionine aminopeptidase n=1 Tax=candidate division MSBL1 archaeon SCGC-AAA385D11 TaxID=1698286 RepID=A0A133VP40_9EURY|nr:methionine aminopeptidase [candidate division MSBL1 archaeon SCGC-AAA385D11]